MSLQLPFDLAYRTAQGADDFIISPSNEMAVKWLERYPNWLGPGLILTGPAGTGKTHLAKIWQGQVGGRYIKDFASLAPALNGSNAANLVIDNADRLSAEDPESLFHLYNRAVSNGTHILLCSDKFFAGWQISLPDLQSRLASLPHVQLHEPDDALLMALFAKQMAARGVSLKMDLIDYATLRLPRSASEVIRIAGEIDRFALQHSRPLNLSLLRDYFAGRDGR